MRDNRIIRPEQMNERDKKVMADAVKSYLGEQNIKSEKRKTDIEQKVESGEYIRIDGKVYVRKIYEELHKEE